MIMTNNSIGVTITQEMENSSSQDEMNQNSGNLNLIDEETWRVTMTQKEMKAFNKFQKLQISKDS